MRMEASSQNENALLEGGVTSESDAPENNSDPMEVDLEVKYDAMKAEEGESYPVIPEKLEDNEQQKEYECTSERHAHKILPDVAHTSNDSTGEEITSDKNQSKEEEIVVTPDCGFFGLSQPGCSRDDPENEDDEKNWEDMDSDDELPYFDNSAEIPETVEALKSALTATESLSAGEGVSEQAKKKASDAIKVAIKSMDDFELSGKGCSGGPYFFVLKLIQGDVFVLGYAASHNRIYSTRRKLHLEDLAPGIALKSTSKHLTISRINESLFYCRQLVP